MEFVQIGDQFINPSHVESVTSAVDDRTVITGNESRKEKTPIVVVQLYSGRRIIVEAVEALDVVKALDAGLFHA